MSEEEVVGREYILLTYKYGGPSPFVSHYGLSSSYRIVSYRIEYPPGTVRLD